MRGVAVRPVRNGAQQGLAAQVRRLQREVDWLRRELARCGGAQAGPHRVARVSGDAADGEDAGAGAALVAAGPNHGGSAPSLQAQQHARERSSMQGVALVQQQRAHAGGQNPKAGAAARERLEGTAASGSSSGRHPAGALADGAPQQHAAGGPGDASQTGAPAAAARAAPSASAAQPAAPVSSPARPGAAGHAAPGPGLLPGSFGVIRVRSQDWGHRSWWASSWAAALRTRSLPASDWRPPTHGHLQPHHKP